MPNSKMKAKYCLVALLALVACSREADLPEGTGYLSVRLAADLAVTPVVKAEAGEPDPAFSLEIIPAGGGEKVTVADYRTLSAEPLVLPRGKYTVKAVSGPDVRVSWEEPRYEGETQVTVLPDRLTEAVVTASLARTMVTVEFDPETDRYFSEYRVRVSNESGDVLDFSRANGNLSKKGYLAATALEWELYMVNTQGTAYRVGPVTIDAVDPRQHYHFRFSFDRTRAAEGSSLLCVLVDDSLNEKYYQLDLDFSGDGLPSISGQGFDLADGIAVKKGDKESRNVVDFRAPQGIKSLTLSHGDAKMLAAGLPQHVQLVEASAATVSALNGRGLAVPSLLYGATEASVDFGPFLAGLPMGEERGSVRALRLFCRALLMTAGILFVSPSLTTDAAAAGLIVLQALLERALLHRAAPASPA